MESLLKEIKTGIYELEDLKEKYPRIETVDVIKMLKRLEQKVKSLLPVVVKSVKGKEIPTFQDWANRKGYYKKGTNWYNERHYQRLYENLIKMYLDEHQL